MEYELPVLGVLFGATIALLYYGFGGAGTILLIATIAVVWFMLAEETSGRSTN